MSEVGSAATVGVEEQARHSPKVATGDAAKPAIQENVANTHLTTKRTPLLLATKAAGVVVAMVERRIAEGAVLEASPTPPQVAVDQLSFCLQQAAVEVAMAAQHGQLVLESSSSQLGRSGSERAREAVEATVVLSEVIGEMVAVAAMVAVVGLPSSMRLPRCSKGQNCLLQQTGLKIPLATCPALMFIATVARALLLHQAFWLQLVDYTTAAAWTAFASISCLQHLHHRHLRCQAGGYHDHRRQNCHHCQWS